MINLLKLTVACLLIGSATATTYAQAVITRLPEEGVWAKYEFTSCLNSTVEQSIVFQERVLTLRSLASINIDSQPYRWIEVEFDSKGSQPKTIFKILICESDIGTKKPFANVKKLWLQSVSIEPAYFEGGSEAMSTRLTHIKDFFVVPERKDVVPLEELKYELKEGKQMSCSRSEFAADIGLDGSTVQIELWENDDSPFGPVKIHWESDKSKKLRAVDMRWVMIESKLVETGTGAKSSLPDQK